LIGDFVFGSIQDFVINFFDIHDNVFYLEAPISPDASFRSHFKIK